MVFYLNNYSFKKSLLLLFTFLLFSTSKSIAAENSKKDLLAFNLLIDSISTEYKNKPTNLPELVKKAKEIVANHNIKNWAEQYIEVHFWEALYYAHKKEPKTSIKILEKIYPLALKKENFRLGRICEYLGTQKHRLDSSFDVQTIFHEVFQKIDTGQKTKFILGLYEGLGIYYYNIKEDDKAIEALRKAASFQDQVKADSVFYLIFLRISALHQRNGELYKALDANMQYGFYAEKLQRTKSVNINKLNRAILNKNLGRFDQAIDTYFELLRAFKKAKDNYNLGITHKSIGVIYNELGNYQKAIEHYTMALEVSKDEKKTSFEVHRYDIYHNLAQNYFALKKYSKSIEICQELIAIANKEDYYRIVGRTYSLMAINFKNKGNKNQALTYYKKAFNIHQKNGDEFETALTHKAYGHFLIETGKIQEGGNYCKKAFDVLGKLDDIRAKSDCLKCLSEYYEKSGDYKTSLSYSKEYLILKDSFLNNQNVENITSERLKYEYQNEQLANQHKLEQLTILSEVQEAKLQRRNVIIAGSILLFLLSFLFLNYRYKQNKNYSELMKIRNEELNENNEKLGSLYEDLNLKNTELNESNFELNQRKIQAEGELKSKLLLISSFSETFSALKQGLSEDKTIDEGTKAKFGKIIRQNDNKDLLKEIDFGFMELNKDFVRALTSQYSNLTNNNIKLCVLIKMNLYTKEIAQIMHASTDSIKVAKSRLRKKFNIDSSEYTLVSYLNSLSSLTPDLIFDPQQKVEETKEKD